MDLVKASGEGNHLEVMGGQLFVVRFVKGGVGKMFLLGGMKSLGSDSVVSS